MLVIGESWVEIKGTQCMINFIKVICPVAKKNLLKIIVHILETINLLFKSNCFEEKKSDARCVSIFIL